MMSRSLFTDINSAWSYAEKAAHTGESVAIIPGSSVGAPITVTIGEVNADEFRKAVKQLCKDFSDSRERPYMGDVYAQIDALYGYLQDTQPCT